MAKKYTRKAHAIEITKRDGRELLQVKEGVLIYLSAVKARDGMRDARAQGRVGPSGDPEIVRVKVTVEKVE